MIYSLMSKERKMVGFLTAFDIIALTRENGLGVPDRVSHKLSCTVTEAG